MKKLLIITAASVALAMPALADYYVTGDGTLDNWTGNGYLMTDMGGGIYQLSLTGLTPGGRSEFKVTQGDWSWSTPGSGNSWFYADGSGDITITYDTNTYSDGWSSASGRIGLSTDPGTWTAVGDWQSSPWNNADPTTAMTSLGGGIYELQYTIATAGTWQYKAVDTGTATWDAIGADARSVNADNLSFTTTANNQVMDFYVNALDGTIKVVPEPASLAFLGFFGLASLLAIRRRK